MKDSAQPKDTPEDAINGFLLQLDALKLVNRRTYINAGERLENSAEHSWHLAMACWSMASYFNKDLSIEKLLKLALVHDLGEIDAGDTFLYADNRSEAHIAERKCVSRFASAPGNFITDLSELWEDQEAGLSPEAKVLKVVDRLLPFLHNIASAGKTWRSQDIRKLQVVNAHAFIGREYPILWLWMSNKIDDATAAGWLVDD
jgi:putative hydrolase of HD superfamily